MQGIDYSTIAYDREIVPFQSAMKTGKTGLLASPLSIMEWLQNRNN